MTTGSRCAAPQVRDAAGLTLRTVQQRVELVAALGRQLVVEQLLDVAVRVGARGGDHPRERVDGRAQHLAGAQVFSDEDDQGCRGVVLDGPLDEPVGQALAVAVVDAPPPEVGERELQWSLRVWARVP